MITSGGFEAMWLAPHGKVKYGFQVLLLLSHGKLFWCVETRLRPPIDNMLIFQMFGGHP